MKKFEIAEDIGEVTASFTTWGLKKSIKETRWAFCEQSLRFTVLDISSAIHSWTTLDKLLDIPGPQIPLL